MFKRHSQRKGKGDAASYKNKYASDKCARVKYSRNYGIKNEVSNKDVANEKYLLEFS